MGSETEVVNLISGIPKYSYRAPNFQSCHQRSSPSFPPQNCSTPSRATRKSISVRVRTGNRGVAGHSR